MDQIESLNVDIQLYVYIYIYLSESLHIREQTKSTNGKKLPCGPSVWITSCEPPVYKCRTRYDWCTKHGQIGICQKHAKIHVISQLPSV